MDFASKPYSDAGVCQPESKWKNDGVAAFYEDWPVWVLVEDEDGNSLEKEAVDISLKSLLPEETFTDKNKNAGKKDDLTGRKEI